MTGIGPRRRFHMGTRKAENSCPVTRGFTLIELLVVIAILSILVAILMPTLCRAREIARKRVCQTRLSAIQSAAMQRSAEWLGYVAQNDPRNCWVATKAQMIDSELETGAANWGTNGADNHYWSKDYPLHYMGLAKADWATALGCPSQSEEQFVNNDEYKTSWEGQLTTYNGRGYGMSQNLWKIAPHVPLPGGGFLVAQGWWLGRNPDRNNDYVADCKVFWTTRTYVRGLNAVSNLVAFGDSWADQANAGHSGFRHDGGGGYQNWYKNVVFWDGHVGDYEYLSDADLNKHPNPPLNKPDKKHPYWKDTSN
jgi:prepilin-type N-terminal cleavage/methylation domain-containing protein